MSSHYQNWAPGEPNDAGGAEDRLIFVGLGVPQSPKWADVPGAALLLGYVVEYQNLPGAPSLSIAINHRPSTLTLSWPAPAEGWLLQTTADLLPAGTVWTVIPPPYPTAGSDLQFTDSAPLDRRFYRLVRP